MGFVIFRYTYGYQEKWVRLLTLDPHQAAHARAVRIRDMLDVCEKEVWAVFEDPSGLDGADLTETSGAVRQVGVVSGDGSREWEQEQKPEGSPRPRGYTASQPRYWFYLHVHEESLESVMDDDDARDWHGKCAKDVRLDVVLQVPNRMEAEDGNEDEDEEDEEDEYDTQEKRKLIKIDEILDLYARLPHSDRWWNILMEKGVCMIC